MALELASGITASATDLTVAGTLTDEIVVGYRFRLDDELLRIADFGSAPVTGDIDPRAFVGRNRLEWRVARGLENSTPATHADATAVLGVSEAWVSGDDDAVPDPWAGGGVGETPTLAEVLAAGDEATGLAIFLATAEGPSIDGSAGEGSLDVTAPGLLTLTGDSIVVNATGALALTGDSVLITASTGTIADANGVLTIDEFDLSLNPGQISFFGATLTAQPQVPATPTEQDIVDALVALGLVTQAAP